MSTSLERANGMRDISLHTLCYFLSASDRAVTQGGQSIETSILPPVTFRFVLYILVHISGLWFSGGSARAHCLRAAACGLPLTRVLSARNSAINLHVVFASFFCAHIIAYQVGLYCCGARVHAASRGCLFWPMFFFVHDACVWCRK